MLLNNPKDLNLLCWYERNVHMHCVPSVTSYGILFSHRSIRMKRNHVPFALHDSIHIWNNKIVLRDDSSMNVPKNVHHLDTFNSHDFISRKINCQHNSWKFRSNFLCTFFEHYAATSYILIEKGFYNRCDSFGKFYWFKEALINVSNDLIQYLKSLNALKCDKPSFDVSN